MVGRTQRFGEACCLHLQGRSKEPGLRLNINMIPGGEIWRKGPVSEDWGRKWAWPMRRLHSFLLTLFLRLPFLQPYTYVPSESLLITLALKMETAHFSETLASTNQSTRRLNQKNIVRIVIAIVTLNLTHTHTHTHTHIILFTLLRMYT
jgi:hypothetical protein